MMKKSGILGIAIVVTTIVSLAYCQAYTKRVTAESYAVEFAKRNLPAAEIEIISTQKDVNSDFEKFIKEANEIISSNEKRISEITFESTENTKVSLEDFSVIVKSIGKKNYNIKMKLDYYVEEGSGNWQTFKTDLYADLADIDLAIKNN